MAICLWFDGQAEEAATFYTSVFKDSEIGAISRFGKEGVEHHGQPEGTAMVVEFRLNNMKFIALNGGPQFKFAPAISVVVYCETQEEIDHYWTRLTESGQEQQCGWLQDQFGVSWQIVPTSLARYMTTDDPIKRSRVQQVLYQSIKFNIQELELAYNGK